MQPEPPAKPPSSDNPYAAPTYTTPPQLIPERLRRRWLPCIALWVIAVISGFIWRAELELTTGWASLDWISHFHWAVPAGVLAFIIWVLFVTRVLRPGVFAAALFVHAFLAYFAVSRLLLFSFGRIIILFDDEKNSALHQLAVEKLVSFLLIVLVPLTFSILCRFFGVRVRLQPVISSAVLFMLSWPLAAFTFFIIEHRELDPIHALKSGYVIPMLILSLGLPVLRARHCTQLP